MEEVPDSTVTWTIDNLEDMYTNIVSPKFKIRNVGFYLHLKDQDNICCPNCDAYMVHLHLNEETFHNKIFCKLCLINGRGEEILDTERNVLPSEDCIDLMLIEMKNFYLEEYNLLPGDTLTLRLSLNEEESPVVSYGDTETASDLDSEMEDLHLKEHNLLPGSTLIPRMSLGDDERPVVSDGDIKTASDLHSGLDSAKLFEKLGKELGTFYESKTLTDCVLIVGNEQFAVHRAVLAARSPVFAAMFDHDTSEKRSGEVVIQGIDPAVLSDVLYYVYSGQVRGLTTDTAAPMYIVADKYAFTEMKDICLDFLMSNLTIDNVSDAAVVAHAHRESALENEVIKLIELNSEELVENDRWKEFYQSNPYLAIKYLHSALVSGNKHKPQKLK